MGLATEVGRKGHIELRVGFDCLNVVIIKKNKVNVYLTSLKVKVPDHVYVFRNTFTC
jgi:hypothetical protein